MKNPKTWSGPTPVSHSGKIDKSGSSRTNWDTPTGNAEREWTGPTPYNHSKPIPRSSKSDLGNPRAMSSDRSFSGANTTATTTPKSKPTPPADPVKWHKQSRYTMSVPATMAEGAAVAAKMKAK